MRLVSTPTRRLLRGRRLATLTDDLAPCGETLNDKQFKQAEFNRGIGF